jgi:DNA polymerase III subunit beta
MILHISAANLAEAATAAAHAIRTGRTNHDGKFPVLSCCRLTAGRNLSIYGTDLDTGISAMADCDVAEPGEAVVNGRKLADIAAKLKGDIAIHTTATDLIVKCGRARFTLALLPVEDFPAALEVEDNAPAIDLAAADLMAIFAGVATAVSKDDRRMYLAGTTIFGDSGRLVGVGTDGIMLSYAATAAACHELDMGVIVHRDTCKTAVSMFGKTGATMRVSKNLVEFASGGTRLVAKLVDAPAPAWCSVVPPTEVGNVALVKRGDLMAALERCAAIYSNLIGDAAKMVPSVTIRWSGSSSVYVAYGDGAPAAMDVFDAEASHGRADIRINPRLLLQLLDAMEVPALTDIDRSERLEADSLSLSIGIRPGEMLRIDAGPDRFVVLPQMIEFAEKAA